MDGEWTRGGRVSERTGDDVEEESGRREIRGVPMPCAEEMGLREGLSMCVCVRALCV